jgi:hypothetical protein
MRCYSQLWVHAVWIASQRVPWAHGGLYRTKSNFSLLHYRIHPHWHIDFWNHTLIHLFNMSLVHLVCTCHRGGMWPWTDTKLSNLKSHCELSSPNLTCNSTVFPISFQCCVICGKCHILAKTPADIASQVTHIQYENSADHYQMPTFLSNCFSK